MGLEEAPRTSSRNRRIFVTTSSLNPKMLQLKVHADLNISLYVCVYIKELLRKFHIFNSKNSRVIYQ